MASQVLAMFDDFSGGHYEAHNAEIPQGHFSGRNMMLQNDGTVTPRPGVRDFTMTGLTDTTAPMAAWTNGVDIFYITVNGDLCRALNSGAWTQNAGTSWTTQQLDGLSLGGGTSYVGSSDLGIYSANESTLAITGLNPNAKGNLVTVFKDRVFVAGELGAGLGYRVYYSNAAAYTTFPSVNYFDLPPAAGRISIMRVWNDQLYFGVQNSAPEAPRWFVLTDVPQNGGVLQALPPGPYPVDSKTSDMCEDLGIVYQATTGLFTFKGGDHNPLLHAIPHDSTSTGSGTNVAQICRSLDNKSLIVTRPAGTSSTTEQGFYYYDGKLKAWSRHPITSINLAGYYGKLLVPYGNGWVFVRNNTITNSRLGVVWTPHTSTAQTITDVDIVDGSQTAVNGRMTMSVIIPDGMTARVGGIAVDFTEWGTTTNYNVTNNIDAYIGYTRMENVNQPSAAVSSVHNLYNSNDARVGYSGRVGTGLRISHETSQVQVTLDNVRGVSIKRVIVFGTIEPARWAR